MTEEASASVARFGAECKTAQAQDRRDQDGGGVGLARELRCRVQDGTGAMIGAIRPSGDCALRWSLQLDLQDKELPATMRAGIDDAETAAAELLPEADAELNDQATVEATNFFVSVKEVREFVKGEVPAAAVFISVIMCVLTV
ncbi:hypothetical protein PF008_g30386 [Phytophthora fragariae]|uniref:Uncharacterized protein n=1 Tax=Phytophthora fragariae TaxID=53985 RepID=A0A6G0Q5N3_9STRA|nr:hypothetical protein PF008_g30386 [Phytophthora fragariae]